MTFRRIAFCAVFCWVLALVTVATAAHGAQPSAAKSGPILTLIERDLDGDPHDVPSGRATVDINSLIAIGVSHGALVARLPTSVSGSLTAGLLTDYLSFQTSVTAMARATTPLALKMAAVNAATTPDGRNQAILDAEAAIADMGDATEPLLEYALARDALAKSGDAAAKARRSSFFKDLNAALKGAAGTSRVTRSAAIEGAGNAELKRLESALSGALKQEGVRLMMAAWVETAAGTRSVHLPGFDDYPDQPRYEVDRFSLVFTEQQQQQYKNAKDAATLINKGATSEVVDQVVLDFVNRSFPDTLDAMKKLEEACQAFAAAAKSAPNSVVADVKALTDQLTDDLSWFESTIASLKQIAETNPSGLGQALQAAVDGAILRVSAIKVDVETLQKDVDAQAHTLEASITGVTDALKNLSTAAEKNLKTLWNGIAVTVAGRDLNAAALAFGDKVKRFDLDNLPASTQLDLELTGQRADGDLVAIKVGMERPGLPAQDLEVQSLVLRRMLVHVETAAGLVFTTRPRQPSDGSKKVPFQAAPAYSAFLKKGWRGCALWNNVLTPGIGVSVAAVDFNLDGVPEIGIGGAVAILRDWLQGGFGYNVFQRRWYGFVGIGLPLPTFGMTTVSNSGGASASAGAARSP
jgi:hypothetical protein